MSGQWKHRVNVRQYLTEEGAENDPASVGQRIAEQVKRSDWYISTIENNEWDDLRMIVSELEDVDDVDHLDAVLAQFYDIADADRVWLG